MEESFEWDFGKEALNIQKHKVDFKIASLVFKDPKRLVYIDQKNSYIEDRKFCTGKVDGKIITIRFVHRGSKIRIIGAGYWRKGARLYEKGY